MIKRSNRKPEVFRNYSSSQMSLLVILRVAIGWHFRYEGATKILNPNWTSIGFLLDSKGFFSGLFHSMAVNADVVTIVNFLNVWGMTAIGLGLIAGLFTQVATIAGMILLSFYYISHPPLIGVEYLMPSEGNYLYVNKNLIEFFTLWVLYLFPTGTSIGLDRFIFRKKSHIM